MRLPFFDSAWICWNSSLSKSRPCCLFVLKISSQFICQYRSLLISWFTGEMPHVSGRMNNPSDVSRTEKYQTEFICSSRNVCWPVYIQLERFFHSFSGKPWTLSIKEGLADEISELATPLWRNSLRWRSATLNTVCSYMAILVLSRQDFWTFDYSDYEDTPWNARLRNIGICENSPAFLVQRV